MATHAQPSVFADRTYLVPLTSLCVTASLWAVGYYFRSPTGLIAAAAFGLLSLALTILWLWALDILWKVRVFSHPAGRPPRVRRTQRNTLWLAIASAVVIFANLEYRLITSFKARTHPSRIRTGEQGDVAIYVGDGERTKAMQVEVIDSRGDHSMLFAMAGVPRRNVVVNAGDKTITLDVVVRNTSGVGIHNARVRIDSNVPLSAAGEGLSYITDSAVGGFVPELRPSGRAATGQTFRVQMPVPHFRSNAGVLVTVEGENLRPVAAAVKLSLHMRAGTAVAVSAPQLPAYAPATKPIVEPVFESR